MLREFISRVRTIVPSYYRMDDSRTIVQQSFSVDSLFDGNGMTLTTDQRTTFRLDWTRFCVTDNDFCNSLLFSIRLFIWLLFHVYIHMLGYYTLYSTFAVLPENGTLKLSLSHRPIVLTDSIDYRTIGLLHDRPNPNN